MTESGSAKFPAPEIGEVAKPPVAVLPNPASLFLGRSKRLLAVAPEHKLAPYLHFLAAVTRAQHDIQASLPEPSIPSAEEIARAVEFGAPPLSRDAFEPDELTRTTLDHLLEKLERTQPPAETVAAIHSLQGMTLEERNAAITDAISDARDDGSIAQRALVLAALQVHFTRMAAKLDLSCLKPVADGACPACGSPPLASSIVDWPNASNTRFCTCSLCATMWYVVRVKCLLCGSNEKITFQQIDGQPEWVKAESCDKCRGYVKVFYQTKNPALEPLADDVASLGLDMLLAEEGWRRGGFNPFLMGY